MKDHYKGGEPLARLETSVEVGRGRIRINLRIREERYSFLHRN